MRSRTAAFALVLGALGVGSCLVYDKGDLTGPPGAGEGGGAGFTSGSGGSGLSNPGSGNGGGLSGAGSSNGGGGSANGGGNGGSPSGGMSGAAEGGDGGDVSGGGGSGNAGSGNAGASGSGGAPIVRPELIDDCEDANQTVRPVEGRTGLWYTFVDKAGTLSPAPELICRDQHEDGETGIPADSRRAFHFVAKSVTGNAFVGIDFIQPATRKVPYDATAYKGIRFYAKASVALDMDVLFPVEATDRTIGRCRIADTGTNRCDDHFRFIDGIQLGTAWEQYEVLFDDTAQGGWGQNGLTTITVDKLVSIQFRVAGPSADLWLDEVEFIPSSE